MSKYRDEYDFSLDYEYEEEEVSRCFICDEIDDRLYRGLCIDCLTDIYNKHVEEIYAWYLDELPDDGCDYDTTELGCKEFCLMDDPYYFSDWVVDIHPEWVMEGVCARGWY